MSVFPRGQDLHEEDTQGIVLDEPQHKLGGGTGGQFKYHQATYRTRGAS